MKTTKTGEDRSGQEIGKVIPVEDTKKNAREYVKITT